MAKQKKYEYPKGDFLSGFSENKDNPCSYELECQRMVIRGVQYFDQNPDLFQKLENKLIRNVWDDALKPLIDFMCLHEENKDESGGQTGAMVSHTVKVAFAAKKMGWDNYIKKITNE